MCDKSIVYWYSSLEKHACGYCKNQQGNISHGMWAKFLTVQDYQNLIDRGWRRSGNYCYKPLMDQICCPMYTIKCDALNFQLSKSQKKVIKKFNKFLKDGVLNKNSNPQEHQENFDNQVQFFYREAPKQMTDNKKLIASSITVDSDKVVNATCDRSNQSTSHFEPIAGKDEAPSSKEEKLHPKSGAGADPNKPPCKKAKILRLERRNQKLLQRGIHVEKTDVKNEQKRLEDFLSEVSQDNKHTFKITLEQIHEKHKYFQLTADLFTKYQIAIHNEKAEECDSYQYLNFLVDTPLQHIRLANDSNLGFGSFHQLYWLDDKLIAVGVIDILPKCVSAVYFFYDPDYRDLTLGTYGSLREVEFVRALHKEIPSIENYYMGFYIHSCPKMRYKGKLAPSYLLCPETYNWIPIENCLGKLDASKYSRLDDDETATDDNNCSTKDVDEMKILINRRLVLFKQYKRKYGGQDLFGTIGLLVGQNCSKSIIFIGDH